MGRGEDKEGGCINQVGIDHAAKTKKTQITASLKTTKLSFVLVFYVHFGPTRGSAPCDSRSKTLTGSTAAIWIITGAQDRGKERGMSVKHWPLKSPLTSVLFYWPQQVTGPPDCNGSGSRVFPQDDKENPKYLLTALPTTRLDDDAIWTYGCLSGARWPFQGLLALKDYII